MLARFLGLLVALLRKCLLLNHLDLFLHFLLGYSLLTERCLLLGEEGGMLGLGLLLILGELLLDGRHASLKIIESRLHLVLVINSVLLHERLQSLLDS